jgi:hypothetical protein
VKPPGATQPSGSLLDPDQLKLVVDHLVEQKLRHWQGRHRLRIVDEARVTLVEQAVELRRLGIGERTSGPDSIEEAS